MKTGDIILFKGDGFFSRLIMAAPGAEYSHVGIYVTYKGLPCVFESTSLGTLPDIITGELINGVQLTRFDKRIRNYKGKVFLRPLIGNLDGSQFTKLNNFIALHHGKPYERSNWELANAELDIMPWHKNKPDDSSLFCSETIAMILTESGIMLPTDKPANEYTPTDFDGDIELNTGFNFGETIRIKGF